MPDVYGLFISVIIIIIIIINKKQPIATGIRERAEEYKTKVQNKFCYFSDEADI